AKDRGPTSRLFVLALLAALACVLAFAVPASAEQFDSFDPTFGSGGLVLSDMASGASALALQPDGKVVLAGSVSDASGFQQLVVTRFNADGAPDKSFNGDGAFLAQLGSSGNPSYLNAVAVQPDGRVVIGGQASDSGGNSRFLVGRLTSTGGWDSSFSGDGRIVQQIGKAAGLAEWVSSLAIQPDGKIVAVGQAADSNNQVELLATRLTSGGGFDSSFSGNGIVLDQLGLGSSPLSRANAVALQPDGKMLLGGDATPANGNGGF